MRIFVTGGAGFIGSNYVHYVLGRHDDEVTVFDALTYAGNLDNLRGLDDDPRFRFVKGDITDRDAVTQAMEGHDVVVHFAAESHVDRSIHAGAVFVETNVLGTQILLDVARARGVTRFVHVSTDEVYGSLGTSGLFTEETPLAPNSPYSASKAASDMLVRAAFHTHGFPGVVTRCSNNYGPYQFPEKLIPLMIANAREDKPLPVYGDGMNVRDWLYVEDHCEALLTVLERGAPGAIYNIGGRNEYPNLAIVKRILAELGKPESLIQFVRDRPGHDRRYAIDASKIERELGWKPRFTFEQALPRTIRWYQSQSQWLQRLRDGVYREYYQRQYGG